MKKIYHTLLLTILLFFSTIVILAFIEISLRLANIHPPLPPTFSMAFSGKHPGIGYKAIPNSRWTFYSLRPDQTTRRSFGTVGKDGFRPIVHNKKCKTCLRVIVVGDSITFGAEVADKETWVEIFSRKMSEKGIEIQAKNISFRGFSSLQALLALKEELAYEKKPVHAVIYLFSPNDVAESYEAMYGPTPLLGFNNKDNSFHILEPDFTKYEKAMASNVHLGQLTHIKYYSAIYGLIAKIIKKEQYNWIDEWPKIDSSESAYRAIWDLGTLDVVRKYLGFLVDDNKQDNHGRSGTKFILQEMQSAVLKHGGKFYVAFLPFGAFTEGTTQNDFEHLTELSHIAVNQLLDEWHEFGNWVSRLTQAAEGEYLHIDPNLFKDMTYREYTVLPDDWHYSQLAHERMGKAMADICSEEFALLMPN